MLAKSNKTCAEDVLITSGAFIVGFFASGLIFASIPPGPSKYSICFRASDIGFGNNESKTSSKIPALIWCLPRAARRDDDDDDMVRLNDVGLDANDVVEIARDIDDWSVIEFMLARVKLNDVSPRDILRTLCTLSIN